jgi:hypothetical protein
LICECLIRDVISPALFIGNETDLIINKFIAEMKILVEKEGFPLCPWEGVKLFVKMTGLIISLLWAFAFQKAVLPTPCLKGDF